MFNSSRFLPESPRWLLSQERYDETMAIMQKIGKINGNSPDPDQLLAKLKVNKYLCLLTTYYNLFRQLSQKT